MFNFYFFFLGLRLTKDMKSKKIKDMRQIDEIFEKLMKKL